MKHLAHFAMLIGLLLAALAAGTLVHEVIGHGLTAVSLGGRINRVVILGLQVYPSPKFVSWPIVSGYGSIDHHGADQGPRAHIVNLAGSLSTWLVAVSASIVLWTRRRWYGWPKAVLILLSLYWIDLLSYTLPSWGIRRSTLWGPNNLSEPYEAAVGLGFNGDAFRAFALITSGAMLLSLVLHVHRSRRYAAADTGPPAD